MATSLAPPDLSVFDAVPTLLSTADRRSIVTVQQLIAERLGEYAYLEIGSFRGGSLQPHLRDARCTALYSIDLRPATQADERDRSPQYAGNTTREMLDGLAPAYSAQLHKLTCFESDASDVAREAVPVPPQMCFIDGEHTDAAVLSDFRACLRLSSLPCVVLFDDANIVYGGIRACLEELRGRGLAHRAYVLPDKIGVIEIGELGLHRDAALVDQLASADAYLFATASLDRYRRWVVRIKRTPGVRLARRIQLALSGRRGGRSA